MIGRLIAHLGEDNLELLKMALSFVEISGMFIWVWCSRYTILVIVI